MRKIIFGMSAVKGCGVNAADCISAARADSPYTGIFDFCERVDPGQVNRAAGEVCDDMGRSDLCNVDCTSAMCGDSVVNSPLRL